MTGLSLQTQRRHELLEQLFAAATHEASAAMCRWTNGVVSLSLDEVCEIPLLDVCTSLGIDGAQRSNMVVLTFGQALGGSMILAFDDENGRELAASLLMRARSQAAEWSELERSALMETGNILACAYIDALARLLDAELIPSPPTFIQDFVASVLQQALITQAMAEENILICRTVFQRNGAALNWNVFFIPTPELRQWLTGSLD